MEDLRKYTQKSELYKLSAEEKAEKMQLVVNYPRPKGHGLVTAQSY